MHLDSGRSSAIDPWLGCVIARRCRSGRRLRSACNCGLGARIAEVISWCTCPYVPIVCLGRCRGVVVHMMLICGYVTLCTSSGGRVEEKDLHYAVFLAPMLSLYIHRGFGRSWTVAESTTSSVE